MPSVVGRSGQWYLQEVLAEGSIVEMLGHPCPCTLGWELLIAAKHEAVASAVEELISVR
jgi:hypothetical protein